MMTVSFERLKEAYHNFTDDEIHNERTWEPLIAILNTGGFTAYEYLHFVRTHMSAPLVPNVLVSPKTVEKFVNYRKARIERSKSRVKWVMAQVKSRLDLGLQVSDILTDPELESCATMMYCLAQYSGKTEEAKKFMDGAKYELLISPELYELYLGMFNKEVLDNVIK